MPKKFDRIQFKTSFQYPGGFDVFIDRKRVGVVVQTRQAVHGKHFWKCIPSDVDLVESRPDITEAVFPDRLVAAQVLQALTGDYEAPLQCVADFFSLEMAHLLEKVKAYTESNQSEEAAPVVELQIALERAFADFSPDRNPKTGHKTRKRK